MLPNYWTSKITLAILIIFTAIYLPLFWQKAQEPYNLPFYDLKPSQGAINDKNSPSVSDLCGLKVVECSVEDEIKVIAKNHNWPDEDIQNLVSLAKCESNLNPYAVGGETGCFQGLFQWNVCIRAGGVDNECAMDILCSTEKAITALEQDEQWRWPTCLK